MSNLKINIKRHVSRLAMLQQRVDFALFRYEQSMRKRSDKLPESVEVKRCIALDKLDDACNILQSAINRLIEIDKENK